MKNFNPNAVVFWCVFGIVGYLVDGPRCAAGCVAGAMAFSLWMSR